MALGAETIPDNPIVGADEIIAALDKLTPKLSREVLFNAHKTVLKEVVRPDLMSVLSSFSSASRTSVSIRKAKGTESGAYIGISTKAFWLRFVNYGTKDRTTKNDTRTRRKTARYNQVGRLGRQSGGAYRGRVIGKKDISSTLESRTNAVLKEIQANYGTLVERAINSELQKVKNKFAKLGIG